MSKRQTEWTRAYNEKSYDRIYVTVPKGRKSDIETFANLTNESVNGIINRLIREAMSISSNEWYDKHSEP